MKYTALFLALSLTGCATTEYESYAKAQADVARAKADSDTARYAALANIATTGTESSRIAAVMALALGPQSGNNGSGSQIAAPQPSAALQWASILVPSLTNVAGMVINGRVAMANADNNARIAESTNSAFLGIAGKIQAPVTVTPVAAAVIVPQANVSTVTTTTNDNHAVSTDNHASTTSTTASTSTVSTANPTTTTSTSIGGAGVIGNGTYSTQANPVTTTANPVTTTTTTTQNPVTTTTTQNPITTTTTTNPAGKTCATSSLGIVNCI